MGEKTVTMSVRGLLLTAVVLLGLLSAYLVGGAGGGGGPAVAAAPAADPQGRQRVMTMAGTGEASVVPDQLSFDLAVGLLRPDLDTALDDSSRVMDRVLARLADLGIARGDVQTTELSMYPVYDYHQYSPPTIRGYRVSQRATVLVKQLRQGGRAVSTAVAAGGDDVRVSNIRLRVGDPDRAMEEARDAAVEQARTKAEQYAAAAGQTLGDVVTLREVGAPQRRSIDRGYVLHGLRATADMAAVLPVRAGKDRMKVTVQVVWELG
ncbi:SIMPL domain-containing protein [Nocardioides sp. MAHUQ-72]|uniref:SIMPL domain-containing protein n=1 Tax=unclassified Nocardioides TaxID=2615069 RepID=UPI00360BBA46